MEAVVNGALQRCTPLGPIAYLSGATSCDTRNAPNVQASPASKFITGGSVLKSGSYALSQRRKAINGGPAKICAAASSEGSDKAGPWSVKNDYPEDYVLVSTDPAEVEEELKKIEEENRRLRERIAQAQTDSLLRAEIRRAEIDVTRPRINAQPPTAIQTLVPPATPTVSSSTPADELEALVADEAPAALSPAPTKELEAPVADAPAVLSSTPTEELESSASVNGQRNKDLENAELSRSELGRTIQKTENPMSIVFVSSEVAPYSKTGGLADVVGSLPLALAQRGHRVMVVAPRYMNGVTDSLYAEAVDADKRIKLYLFHGEHEVAFFHEFRDGVDFVFVDHPSYHRPGNPYGDTRGAYGDNQFRFALLCHAACEAPLQLELGGYTYGDKVVFVANDWHAGLVPVLLAAKYRKYNVYSGARSILAIHNLSHQGVEAGITYGNLGLPDDWYGALEWVFPQWARAHELDKGEAVNIMKGAIVTADRILTVSQGYAWEITTEEGGWGLDGLLRSRSMVLNGITNGIDMVDWNPATDKHIASQFTLEDMSGKAECKAALQKELGLPVRPDVPLIGFIGRLDHQKGPDLIQAGLPELMSADVQMVMLGSGETAIESWMSWAENEYRDKFRGWVGFSVPVAHRITAGCDILLMPSRFEPCGLNQLYAMRYGTVPVAHCTGGLRDTIEDFNPFASAGEGAGTGWTFSPLTSEAMMGAMWNAISTYRNHKSSWNGIMERGMALDMSWDRAALQYEQVFQWAMIDPPYA